MPGVKSAQSGGSPSSKAGAMKERPLLTFVLVALVLIPIAVGVISSGLGGFLAVVEGWTWWDGFLYVTSNLVGLGNPLTEVEVAEEIGPQLFDLLIAVWSLSISGTAIGIIGALSFNQFAVHGIEGRINRLQLKRATKQMRDMAAAADGMDLVEFQKAVVDAKLNVTPAEVEELFLEYDKDGSSNIDATEAERLIEELKKKAAGGGERGEPGSSDVALRKEVKEMRREMAELKQMMGTLIAGASGVGVSATQCPPGSSASSAPAGYFLSA